MAPLADVFARLRPDTSGFKAEAEKGVKDAELGKLGEKQGKEFGSSFASSAGSLIKGAVALIGAVSVVDFFKDSIKEAAEAAKVTRLTAAVLASTGGAAHVSAEQVHGFAEALAATTGVNGDIIQSGENVLLTFTQVRNSVGKGNDIFNQGTTAALNLSAALGQDMQSSVIQVGKALNDPIAGMTALKRVGVSFTDSQKEAIKTAIKHNDLLGAQKIILKELATEFGGAAAAATTPAEKAEEAWRQFKEEIGAGALPIIGKLATFFSGTVLPLIRDQIVPRVQEMAGWFRSGFTDGSTRLAGFAGALQGLGHALAVAWAGAKDFWAGLTGGASGSAGTMQRLGAVIRDEVVPAIKTLFGGLAQVVSWLTSGSPWADRFRIAVAGIAAAMLLYNVATRAAAVATAAWAVISTGIAWVQLLSSVRTFRDLWAAITLIMDANPIGLIVVALAALAAGIYLAWTHSATFRIVLIDTWHAIQTAVIDTWHAIEAAIKFAWEDVIKPVADALVTAWRSIEVVAMWLWKNVIKPVWESITEIISTAWAIIKGIFAVMTATVQVLGAIFTWLWKNVIKPVWEGIYLVISIYWALIEVVFGLIQIAIKLLALGFTWLWQHAIKPAWDGISAAISWVWQNVIKPIWEAIKLDIRALGVIFQWLYSNVIKPVWDAIGAAISSVWRNVILPIWTGIKLEIHGLAVVFDWLRAQVKLVWDAIGAVISTVWNNGIKPVLNALGRFITDTVAPAFHAGVDALGRAWNGLLEMAKAPVRFIINTVLNDGLLGAYNWIASKFGVKPDNVHVSLPKGFDEGGYTGAGSETEPAGVVHRGEFVIPKGEVDRRGVSHFMQYLPGYADGGLVGFLKGAWNAITDPVQWLKDKALGLLDHIPGGRWIADQAIGAGRSLIGGAVDWLKKQMSNLFSGGGAGAGNWPASPAAQRGDSGVWRNIVKLINSTGPLSGTFGNAYRAGDPLWHGCVPLETEILTRRGWVGYSDLRINKDETVGYNPLTGKSEWTRVVGIHRYDDAELWTIGHTWWHAEITPGHKWLVDDQRSVQTETVCTECGAEFLTGRGMTGHRAHVHKIYTPRRIRYEEALVETQSFRQSTRIHLSKPAELGAVLPITDDEAELIGWIMADGYMEPYGPTIVQSKPEQVEYLRSFTTRFPCAIYLREPEEYQTHPIYRFALDFQYWDDLATRSGASKQRALDFVLEMSTSQRRAWLRGFLAGDGTRDPRTRDERLGYAAFQVSGPVAEAVKVAAYLEGYRPDTRIKTGFDVDHYGRQPIEHIGLRTAVTKARHLKRLGTRRADVWCPTTTLGTWTARQGEEIFLTGNSGRAVDWMGFNQDALATFFMNRIGSVLELIHRTSRRDYAVTRGVNKGSFNNALMEEHRNHLHIAMDQGGALQPGWNPPVWNGTGRPEQVTTARTMDAVVERLDRLIAAVERVAPGVGREINRTGGSLITLARAT